MKIFTSILFLATLAISANTYAWSFSFDDAQWSDGSGYGQGQNQAPRSMHVIKDRDYHNYYLYIELAGIKPEEVDIQRQGPRITIRQVRGRIEETETANTYRSYESFSSVSRRLTLPPDADPDESKMQRENKENVIRVTIPRRIYQPSL